jgi:hypothetical protein
MHISFGGLQGMDPETPFCQSSVLDNERQSLAYLALDQIDLASIHIFAILFYPCSTLTGCGNLGNGFDRLEPSLFA